MAKRSRKEMEEIRKKALVLFFENQALDANNVAMRLGVSSSTVLKWFRESEEIRGWRSRRAFLV